MLNTAPCVRFWIWADRLRGPQIAFAYRLVQFHRAHKTRDFQRQPLPPASPRNLSAQIQNLTHRDV
jgi:hypothetical protein